MKHQNAVIIFAKNLVPGKVKTRLAASIGNDAAFEVYKELLARTRSATETVAADKIVFYSDEVVKKDEWSQSFLKSKQQGENLGERMMNAFKEIFQQGYGKALIIGTDCPALNESMLLWAFEKLGESDVVLGPAYDGGYYLLAMKELLPCLFENIPWSTSTVFETTIAVCKSNNLSYSLLPTLHDVDEEKDLVHLKKVRA